MAFQKGDIKLEGNIGNLNFYKTEDQYRVRQKVGKKNKNEINNIAERSKENASEFGRASSFAKEIRLALKVAMKDHYELFYEPSHITRLNKRLHLIVKADEENERGKRLVSPVNLKLLKNFSLNIHSPFKDVFLLPIEINYIKTTNEFYARIPKLTPKVHMDIPKDKDGDSVFFRIHLVISKINHSNMHTTAHYSCSDLLQINIPSQSFEIRNSVNNIKESDSISVALGISFYKNVGGFPVPQLTPNRNCLDFLEIFHG